ncbi:hypothetical protein HG535_0C05750 [Zygotorulaspora mrakii]|uniref:Peptidyl-tRNA hydrolase n=1 Tax=Zygotorulaspora mrakii TaxID=42260 RepID=A0A7H9B0R4_ZYGMR|nr:uncharacterized protein HG535_0C05750 [Zygotorulaspora mrakii]QLG72221.1 hypothetical protein HG535_0C05750 [Zygotorulaspora mrakii]
MLLSAKYGLVKQKKWRGLPIRYLSTCLTGIGNPEPQYGGTRHNAGLMMLDLLKDKLVDSNRDKSFKKCSHAAAGYLSAPPDLLLIRSDANFINLSGKTVVPLWRKLTKHGNVKHVVVHDELSLPLGKVQLRKPGTSLRGHNGLKSIYSHLGHGDFYRLAVGIGRPLERDPKIVADYVLAKFTPQELALIQAQALPNALNLLKTVL